MIEARFPARCLFRLLHNDLTTDTTFYWREDGKLQMGFLGAAAPEKTMSHCVEI